MTLLHKMINSAASRLSFGPRSQRSLMETELRHLPEATYWRLQEQGFVPGGIVDIGAHEGQWTRSIRAIFPAPPILMIEARNEQQPSLQRVCNDLPNVEFTLALLGSQSDRLVPFHLSGTGSSIYSERSDAQRTMRTLKTKTLDDVLLQHNQLRAPLFLKLDIQGGEIECLRGGKNALTHAEVVQLEVALLNYNDGAPQAAEIVSLMSGLGFSMFDIAGFIRPNGVNLVQIDVIFVRTNSSLRPEFFSFGSSL